MQLKKVNEGGPAVGWGWEVFFFSAYCKYFQTQPAGKYVHRKTTFSFNIMNESYICVLHQTILGSLTNVLATPVGHHSSIYRPVISQCALTLANCAMPKHAFPLKSGWFGCVSATIHHSSPSPLFVSGNHHEIIQLHIHSSLCPPLIRRYPWWSVFTTLTSSGSLGLF